MVHVLFVYSKHMACQGSSFPKLKKKFIDTAVGRAQHRVGSPARLTVCLVLPLRNR